MPYNGTRLIHDADAHIMETPTWLRDHADPSLRDRIEPLPLAGGNELKQTGDPDEQLARSRRRVRQDRRQARVGRVRPSRKAEIMNRKNFAATGSFVPEDRPRALDQLGFSSQLVFNTFHNRRLRNWEHGKDSNSPYGVARAHNRGMVEFCSVDARLLRPATCRSPTSSAPRRSPPRRSSGRGRAARRRRGARRATRPATSSSIRCGRRRRRPASRSCSTSEARATSSTPTTSRTACRSRPTSMAATRTSARSTTWASPTRRCRRSPR